MGDSRLRQLFKGLRRAVTKPEKGLQNYKLQAKQHHDLSFNLGNTSSLFVWAPKPHDIAGKLRKSTYQSRVSEASLVILNSGLHTISEFGRGGDDKAIVKFTNGMNRIIKVYVRKRPIMKISEEYRIFQTLKEIKLKIPGLVWFEQPPVNIGNKGMLRNTLLTRFNEVAKRKIEAYNGKNRLKFWDAFTKRASVGSDGIHFTVPTLEDIIAVSLRKIFNKASKHVPFTYQQDITRYLCSGSKIHL